MGNLEKAEAALERLLGKSEVSRQSTVELAQSLPATDHLDAVHRFLAELKAAYPNQEITDQTAGVWSAYWVEMIEEYGISAFQEALFRHGKSSRFLPSPADLDTLCRSIRSEQAELKEAMWKKCGDCSNGWKPVRDENGNTFAKRCDCYLRWRAAIQEKAS